MIVDSSVLVAIVLVEPGWEALRDRIAIAEHRAVSAVSLVEAGMVLESRLGARGALQLDGLVRDAGLEVVAFDAAQSQLAREAFRPLGWESFALPVWKAASEQLPPSSLPAGFAPPSADARRPAGPAAVALPWSRWRRRLCTSRSARGGGKRR